MAVKGLEVDQFLENASALDSGFRRNDGLSKWRLTQSPLRGLPRCYGTRAR